MCAEFTSSEPNLLNGTGMQRCITLLARAVPRIETAPIITPVSTQDVYSYSNNIRAQKTWYHWRRETRAISRLSDAVDCG